MSKVSQRALAEYEKLLREKAESDLQIQRYRDANRIEFFDTAPNPGPNPRQKEILEAWLNRFYEVFTLTGGNRLGKTSLSVLLAYATMWGEYPWDNANSRKGGPTRLNHLFNHNEPRKVRYVGQDWEKHIKAVVVPELWKWWPKSRKIKGDKPKKNNTGVEYFWVDQKTGSSLEIMSNGQESDLHEGWSGDLIIYDEPPKRDIRIANARGLVDRNGREFFGMTLLKEAWVDREVIKKTLEDGRPDQKVFNVHGDSYANVGYGINREGLEAYRSKLDQDEVDARIHGIPAYRSGIIYSDFSRRYKDQGGHLVERFGIPIDWIVDIAIDIHPRKEQAILFQATDPRNDRYICQEIWSHGDAKWVAEAIVKAVNYHSYRVNRVIIDPLAKGDANNPQSMYDVIAEILMRYGMILETATKDKEHGILEIKKHLKGPNKQASIFFFDDLVRTIYEIEGWGWEDKTQKASKEDDDMMENLYRLALLKTQWSEPAGFYDYDDTPDYHHAGRDNTTGY